MTEQEAADKELEESAESDDEEVLTLEEEFRGLFEQCQELEVRMNRIAIVLDNSGSEPATKHDLAQVYRFITGDVLSVLKDVVSASGAALNDIWDIVGDADGDGETADDEDDEVDEETVNIYIALRTNKEAFTNLGNTTGFTEEQKTSFKRMADLNQAALLPIEEQFGEELQAKFVERMQGVLDGVQEESE